MRPLPWRFIPGENEPVECRKLLHAAERGNRRAVAMLRARDRLLYWGQNDRTILIYTPRHFAEELTEDAKTMRSLSRLRSRTYGAWRA